MRLLNFFLKAETDQKYEEEDLKFGEIRSTQCDF